MGDGIQMEEMRETGAETQSIFRGEQGYEEPQSSPFSAQGHGLGGLRRHGWRRRKRGRSLRHILYYCIPICAVLAYLGTMAIGMGTNHLQDWFSSRYLDNEGVRIWNGSYEIFVDPDGQMHHSYVGEEHVAYDAGKLDQPQKVIYEAISSAQFILIPLWILACVGLTVWIFYKREIEKPLRVLREASEKIADNCLDFEIEPVKDNELGQLRNGFEKMRAALYENNRSTWQQLEERKRLNAAFAHDMRTPITVLKGYGEMLERYVPEGRISQEKLLEILGMMNGQIRRLESYTQKMSSIRKLEDLEPETAPVKAADLREKIGNMCDILSRDRIEVSYSFAGEGVLCLDEALVLEVCENLVSNAVRYARESLQVTVRVAKGELAAGRRERRTEGEPASVRRGRLADRDWSAERDRVTEGEWSMSGEEAEGYLEIAVEDDGHGFSPEDLLHGADPFYRGEGQAEQSHFGLGLYICRLICARCGGSLTLSNGICGGRVTARFRLECEGDR